MGTFTIYANTNDGWINSQDATYVNARLGTGTVSVDTTSANTNVGNTYVNSKSLGILYNVYETFWEFDTSVVPISDVVNTVALSFISDGGGTRSPSWDFECYLRDWGSTLTTADFVTGAALGGLTLLATWPSSAFSSGVYVSFTENGTNFRTNLNKGGFTRVVVSCSLTRSTTAPTDSFFLGMRSADVAGTVSDPKLVVTTTSVGNFLELF